MTPVRLAIPIRNSTPLGAPGTVVPGRQVADRTVPTFARTKNRTTNTASYIAAEIYLSHDAIPNDACTRVRPAAEALPEIQPTGI